MNKQSIIATRASLQAIIQAYERSLEDRILSAEKGVEASEALMARDVVRNVGMSRVAKTRIERIVKPRDSGANVETSTSALIPEIQTVLSAAAPDPRTGQRRDTESLFRNLKDCIPCNQKWDWKDFDWSKLLELLKLDLKSRFAWLLDLEDFLDDRSWLDELCAFFELFRNLCPGDLLPLIASLVAFLMRTLDAIKINLTGALKDILGMMLRPYIAGLEDFLNMYIQFYVDQIQCLLNLLIITSDQASKVQLRSLKEEVGGALGIKVEPSKDPPWKLDPDNPVRVAFETTNRAAIKVDKTINEDRRRLVRGVANLEFLDGQNDPDSLSGIPVISAVPRLLNFIVAKTRSGVEWIEDQAAKIQDAMIDLLGGEWLITKTNMSFAQDLKAVSTIIQILKAFLAIGDFSGLCDENNVRKVIDILNDDRPDSVIIDEDVEETGPLAAGVLLPSNSPSRVDGSTNNQTGINTNDRAGPARFSLKKCFRSLNETEQNKLERYIAELNER